MRKLINHTSALRIPAQVFSLDVSNIPYGHSPTNPSICSFEDHFFVNVRSFSFSKHAKGSWNIDNVNYLLRLDKSLNKVSFNKLSHPVLDNKVLENTSFGFEDPRIFIWNDKLWSLSTTRSLFEDNLHRMVISEIDKDSFRFLGYRVITPEGIPPRHEKNWMPVVKLGRLFFVYFHDPYMVLDVEGKFVVSASKNIPSQFRGGSQLIPFLEGHISIVHEVVNINWSKKVYLHRFVFYDKKLDLKRISEPFYFLNKGIEFVAGACFEEGNKSLLVSFGVEDKMCKIARIDTNFILDSLKHTID